LSEKKRSKLIQGIHRARPVFRTKLKKTPKFLKQLWPEIETVVRNLKFCQKHSLLTKNPKIEVFSIIEIFLNNQIFFSKSKFFSKNENFLKNPNFSQKIDFCQSSKFFGQKMEVLVNDRFFCQKSKKNARKKVSYRLPQFAHEPVKPLTNHYDYFGLNLTGHSARFPFPECI